MLDDPVAMVEHLSIAIGPGGAAAVDHKASDAHELAIVDGRATRVAVAGAVVHLVGQAEHAIPVDGDGGGALQLRYGAERIELQLARQVALVPEPAPAGDDHVAADRCLRAGQWNGAYLVGVDERALQLQQRQVVPEAFVFLVHSHVSHIPYHAADEAVQGAGPNGDRTGRRAAHLCRCVWKENGLGLLE